MKLFQIRNIRNPSIFFISFPCVIKCFYITTFYLLYWFKLHSQSTIYYIEYIVLQGIQKEPDRKPIPKDSRSFEFERRVFCHFVCCYCLFRSPGVINGTPSFTTYTLPAPLSTLSYPYAITSRKLAQCERRHAKNACANSVKLSFCP